MIRPRRRWRDKFAEAANGVVLAIRGQSSFVVHFLVAVGVVLAAALLKCDWSEWCLLILCIGLVLTAEVFNAALETLFHALDSDTKNRMVGCLDRAAGAVLLASMTSAIIGIIIFGRKLYGILN